MERPRRSTAAHVLWCRTEAAGPPTGMTVAGRESGFFLRRTQARDAGAVTGRLGQRRPPTARVADRQRAQQTGGPSKGDNLNRGPGSHTCTYRQQHTPCLNHAMMALRTRSRTHWPAGSSESESSTAAPGARQRHRHPAPADPRPDTFESPTSLTTPPRPKSGATPPSPPSIPC